MFDYKKKLQTVPHVPGCYIWKNRRGQILYIGKAKDLNKRIKQYFTNPHNNRISHMTKLIADFDYIIVNNEKEALLLEETLIKKHLPPYNVKITDDSRYPYVVVTKEKHPRLFYSRTREEKIGKYYGPLPDGNKARDITNLLNRVFPFKKCNPPRNPKLGDQCLYYHMGQCKACAPKEEREAFDYKPLKRQVHNFFKGEFGTILKDLKSKELKAASTLDFETAQEFKELQSSVEKITDIQKVNLIDNESNDVLGFHEIEGHVAITIFSYYKGKLNAKTETVFAVYEEKNDYLTSYLMQYYKNNNKPKNLLVSDCDLGELGASLGFKIVCPKQGLKKQMIDLAMTNARNAVTQKFLNSQREYDSTIGAAEKLGEMLGIGFPRVIEAFDNSSIAGTNSVSGMICFKNGIPSKKDYRKFKIQTTDTQNDYANIQEVIYRRYFRLFKEKKEMPDLIVVDGAVAQVNAALSSLQELRLKIPVIGLGKDEKHKTRYLVTQNLDKVFIDKNDPLFFFLTRIQDEVHRYSITFHRQVRSKSMIRSKLDGIPGLGQARQNKLMKEFKTLSKIKNSTVEELSKHIPENVAKNVIKELN